uniref:PPC domain-containing protein n=1 Tax=Setaria viridis TaxID=4556 RepID=A0A4V6D115_SETVI|nr:hypothetical protein SEVIR_9G192400v2 [Setaria viridis]
MGAQTMSMTLLPAGGGGDGLFSRRGRPTTACFCSILSGTAAIGSWPAATTGTGGFTACTSVGPGKTGLAGLGLDPAVELSSLLQANSCRSRAGVPASHDALQAGLFWQRSCRHPSQPATARLSLSPRLLRLNRRPDLRAGPAASTSPAASASPPPPPPPASPAASTSLARPRGLRAGPHPLRPDPALAMLALAMAPAPAAVATGASLEGKQQGVLEVAPGTDVSACVAEYARRRGRGVCVLGASGAVADVVVRGAAAPLRGRFELLSVTGTVLPPPAPPEAGADGGVGDAGASTGRRPEFV